VLKFEETTFGVAQKHILAGVWYLRRQCRAAYRLNINGNHLFFSPCISCWRTRRDAFTKSKGHSPKLLRAFAQLEFAQLLLHYSTALFVDTREGR
jgi:hypothetical protein